MRLKILVLALEEGDFSALLLVSSEHCLSAPTDTEEASKPKLEPQRRSDTVPDLDRVCWKV